MGRKIGCPRCQHAKSWSIRRGKSRCAACHYEWVPRALPLRLSPGEWRRLLRWFVLGQSAEVIAQEARLERKRVLRALIVVRQAMVRDVPMSSPAWWRSTRPTWEVPGATDAWQSVFRARSGAVEPLSKLSLGSCVEVAWCGRKWCLTWKPRRCCRSCTNACNVAPSSARTPLPATRASQRGATSTGLWTTARRSAIGKGATSTAWRASGVISSGVWQPKGESAENGCPSILLSMSGATIIGVCWDQNRLRHCSSCFKANPVAKTGLYPKSIQGRGLGPAPVAALRRRRYPRQ